MEDESDSGSNPTIIGEHPLAPLCKRWWSLLKTANERKQEDFGNDAREIMKFYTCGKELHEAMWARNHTEKDMLHSGEEMPAPRFRVVVGKVAEGVELFGPTLYESNPSLIVNPKSLKIPDELLFPLIDPQTIQQAQMQAQQAGQPFNMASLIPPDPKANEAKITSRLIEYFINYAQRENDKESNIRRVVDETIIKGAGVLWSEIFETYPGGPSQVGSFYDTIDNLLIDPDSEVIDEAWWIARKRVQPLWFVAQKFGLEEDYLSEKYGTTQSYSGESWSLNPMTGRTKRKDGQTADLIEYWEVYSKMGFGSTRLKGTPNADDRDDEERMIDAELEQFGDNVYFAISEKVPFPLNFHTDHLHDLLTEPDQEVLDQKRAERLNGVSWPVPYWVVGEWPMTFFSFHEVPGNLWPMSHFKPGLGYLKFLNWVISFLVNKIRISARSVAATFASTEDETKDRLFSGKDFEVLELKSTMGVGADINKLVSFLQMPEVHPEVWKIVESVFDLFDKATGLTEIMYGMPGGSRSAYESKDKEAKASIRTNDMAERITKFAVMAMRKETIAARWLLERDSIQPVLGDMGTDLWERFVASKDIETIAREYEYRVEVGTDRKPDRQSKIDASQQMVQAIPPLLQLAANPQFLPVVNFLIGKLADANEWELKEDLIQPPPPPPPNPMVQKVQAEIQGKQTELQMKQQTVAQELQMAREKHQIELDAIRAKAGAQTQIEAMKLQAEAARAHQEMSLERARHQQDVTLSSLDALQNIAARERESRAKAASFRNSPRDEGFRSP